MSNPLDTLRSLLHPRGVAGPARVRSFKGGSAISYNASACRPAFLVALAIALCALAYTAAAAQAETGGAFLFHFTGAEPSQQPVGVAVDGSADSSKGDVYVVHKGNNREERGVKKFSISGETATQLWEVHLEASGQDTVDDYAGADEGDLFVAGRQEGVVYEINPEGTTVTEVVTGLEEPTGVAVDAANDFFVSLKGGSILEFNASWEPINANGMVGPNAVVEGLSEPQTVAVSADGEQLYAATGEGAIQFTPMAGAYAYFATLDGAPATGVTLGPEGNVFVDQEGNEVAIYEPSTIYESSGTKLSAFGAGVLGVHEHGGLGLAVRGSDVFVADEEDEQERVDVFELGPDPETPEVTAASGVTGTSATLNGSLKPAAGEATAKYFFEYNTGSSCAGGTRTPVKKGSGEVSEQIGDLALLTGYTFCLHTETRYGHAESAPESFETLALGDEDSPIVTAEEVEVSAQLATSEETTTYQVQYGTGSVEESTTAQVTVPAASAPVTVEQRLGGLKVATTYHYRFLLSNAHGHVTGEERTFTTPAAVVTAAETCPNAKQRAEQPYGLGLPDCRAYEIVSPLNTEGQDATDSFNETAPRAAVSGEAIVYTSKGTFANPTGDSLENQFVSRRNAENDRWETQAVTPPEQQQITEDGGSVFLANDLTPELTEGVAVSSAKLTPEAPAAAPGEHALGLYVDDFANGSYRYVNGSFENPGGSELYPVGSSTDLTHVVFGETGAVSEWVDGTTVPVSVTNDGETLEASVGGIAPNPSLRSERNVWHAVSADGSRVYFSSPHDEEQGIGQLYVRVHAEQPQSAIAHPEANATATLKAGSEAVSEVTPVFAAERYADLTAGSTAVNLNSEGTKGTVYVGQSVTGPGIPAGTTVTGISGTPPQYSATLSAPATLSNPRVVIDFFRPDSFTVGEQISGYGIPPGTTVTAASGSTLTLSAASDVSDSAIALNAGGECTQTADACTIEVSASQRTTPDTHGLQAARYWGASEDGARVFFTSDAELTNDAYTGTADEAANLYEYDLETGKLTDLTGKATDASGEGAAVQGVVQISEDGSYVYFVADGALTGPQGEALQNERGEDPRQGEPNLYVSHEDGAPVFVATLAASDDSDWNQVGNESGPEVNTAVVTPGGSRLAFLSGERLKTVNFPAGYDNEPADPANCRANYEQELSGSNPSTPCTEIFLYNAETNMLECASCNPTGARPVGPSSFTTKKIGAEELYRARNLLEDGALFFDSSDALVLHAGDGRRNVYEYENGHVYAISDVAGGYESFFMDASANGANVFFATADRLLPQVTSNNVVVYDARVDGGFPVNVAPLACTTAEACRTASSPTPTVFGAPPSVTFSGPGNVVPPPPTVVKPKSKPLTRAQKLAKALKVCAKDKQKSKRAKCQKQAKQKYGPAKKKAKKSATTKRRTH